jgi:integrase
MPRKPSGQLKWWGSRYSVRVRFKDGRRRWVSLPADLTHTQAVARAHEIAHEARGSTTPLALTRLAAADGETVERWAERWFRAREERGLESYRDDRSRFRTHLRDIIGKERMATVSSAKLEDVRDALDKKVRGDDISWKTAQHVWAVVRGMFRDARASKQRDLRVRDDNPCLGIAPPDRGSPKAKQYLFPSEFDTFARCGEIPIFTRRVVALTTYLFLRASELEALGWDDIDFEHGTVHVHRSLKRYTRVDKSTKTGGTRRFAIEPAIMPLLKVMAAETGGRGRVLADVRIDKYGLSRVLRASLALAGVEREELYGNDATRKWITFHDLRATGITWMAVRGDDPLKIKQRAGHAHLSTTEKYIRVAEELRPGFGDVFPPLPKAIVRREPAARCA